MKKLPLFTVLVTCVTIQLLAQNSNKSNFKTINLNLVSSKEIIHSKENTFSNNDLLLKKGDKLIDKVISLEKKKPKTNFKQTETLFPNPAKDFVNIKTLPNSAIRVYDKGGNTIKNFKNVFGESFIDIRDLNKGIYYVDIKEPDSETRTEKFYIK